MNMNYSYQTTMYESILAQMYAFLVLFACFCFLPRKSFKQKLQKIFFYQKYVHLGENNFIHFSRITVIHIRVIFFSKIHHSCYSVTNTESNEEVTKND